MQNDKIEIKLDENGNPDAYFYIQRAHELRSQELAEISLSISTWLKGLKAKMFAKQQVNSTRSFGTV